MTERARRGRWLALLAWIVGFVVTTTVLVQLIAPRMSWQKPCPDYVCYWAAGNLLARGESPYDFAKLEKLEQEYGWDKDTDGLGVYAFLPYYYPPSLLGLVCVLLVPLGFTTARLTWLVGNAELLVVVGYMLRSLLPTVSGKVCVLLLPLFCLSLMSVLVGQLTALIFFLIVSVWTLLEKRLDRSAGWVLAWMTMKPQLTALLLMAVLLWSMRERRWRVLEGFAAGTVALLLLSTWLVPEWPFQLLQGMRETPVLTMTFPWIGTTWLLALRSFGLEGAPLVVLYTAVAVPFFALVVRYALEPGRPLGDVLAMSVLAAFFVAPTGRPYDQPLLLLVLLVLIARRGSDVVAAGLLFTFVFLPYVHFFRWTPDRDGMPDHVWFFWIPLTLALAWFLPRRASRGEPAATLSSRNA